MTWQTPWQTHMTWQTHDLDQTNTHNLADSGRGRLMTWQTHDLDQTARCIVHIFGNVNIDRAHSTGPD